MALWGVGGEGIAPRGLSSWTGVDANKIKRGLTTCWVRRVCDEPSSEDPHEWPDDITKWPVSQSERLFGVTLVMLGRNPHFIH